MKPLFIDETDVTPKVIFTLDGILSIQGRSMPLDAAGFYHPVQSWVKELTLSEIHLLFRIEYLNTKSAIQLYTILQSLRDNERVTSLHVDWYYEEDDEDIYDIGLKFESLLQIPFNFYVYVEK